MNKLQKTTKLNNTSILDIDAFLIEQSLIYRFLTENNIAYKQNRFLSTYFEKFNAASCTDDSISNAKKTTFDDLFFELEQLIPNNDRKLNGAFFTPSYIVDYIVESVHPSKSAKVADISCGIGIFLLGLIRYFQKHHNTTIKECVKKNIYGVDILDYNVRRCKLLIIIYGLLNNENIEEDDINVICDDSLNRKWEIEFDGVVGNPPYVKFQDLDDITRNTLLEKWETTKYGTFNLYFAFFELGYKLLKGNGKLGYITPNNYFTSLSGEVLRQYFQQRECIYKIVDFNSTMVFSVQTYTAITFLNKKRNGYIDYSRIADNVSPQTYLKSVSFSPNNYTELNTKKWRLLCDNERKIISNIENVGEPIGSMFNICVGIATLKDEVFFVVPTKKDDQYCYFEKNNKEYKVELQLLRSCVKISDMKTQSDIENNKRMIIFPYQTENGKAVVIDEERMKTDYPNCYSYFLDYKDVLNSRGKGKHPYTPFYVYGRTQGLNRYGLKILTPTFSKYPRFLLDKDENSFFTNGYGIYFRATEYTLLQNPLTKQENIDIVLKILNSSIMHYYVKRTSVSIEGGFPCYQKNFIEKFSIPILTESEIKELRILQDAAAINDYLLTKYQINFPLPNLEE